ncbi:hypothetical protein DFJ58DRAFT_731034 [Suillus subalutaceus]|uniref:uncharacterized protein n=1 Tax=Suillus subalutaceus TaxID=48586 RepID=UPI001B88479D|nr:uncharacterized protein DFJ58DRAFT_731034 [Suillus subalutaceus]KAG1844954.1 hypothetical protein DFJ58DRAFT_731034 [Suillus subalutaceus]
MNIETAAVGKQFQDGTKCNFVHFGSPRSSPAAVAHTHTHQQTRSARLPVPKRRVCMVVGCSSTCVNKNCTRSTCRKHCRRLGGCHLFNHVGDPNGAEGLELEDDQDAVAGLPDDDDPAPIECLSRSPSPHLHDVSGVAAPIIETHIEHLPDNLQAKKPTRARTAPACNRASPDSGPRYHMQMPEVFTMQLAETSKREEEQCQRHADEIEAQNRAWYHTVVYSWVKDGGQPNMFEFQSGTSSFTWPHLSLNHQVISLMGLATAGVDEGVGAASIIHVWNHRRREWRGVQPGYLITVVEGQPVLLKNPNVTQCVDLDSCIRSISDSPPNLRSHLAADRAAVREELRQHHNVLPAPNEVVFHAHSHSHSQPHYAQDNVKMGNSPSELEVEALLLSKGKGKAKPPLETSPSPPPAEPHSRQPSLSYSAYSIPSFGTPSPPPKPFKRNVRRRSPRSPTTSVDSSSPPPRTRRKPLERATARPLVGSSTAHAAISGGTLSDPIDVDNDVKVRPGDFYTCDIAKGFRLCETISKRRQGVGAVFQKMFGVPYASTTYHTHKKRWADAPANVMDKFIKAGRTEDGLWSKFMAETRS